MRSLLGSLRLLVPLFGMLMAAAPGFAQKGEVFFVPQTAPFRGLMAADSGYMILNPTMVAGPGVSRAAFSPNGRYLVAARRELSGSAVAASIEIDRQARQLVNEGGDSSAVDSIILYNVVSHHSSVVWSQRPVYGAKVQVRLIGWLGGSSRVLATMHISGQLVDGKPMDTNSVLFIDVDRGSSSVAFLPMADNYVGLSPSSTIPFAAVLNPEGGPDAMVPNGKGGKDHVVQFLRADGSLTDPTRLPTFVWFNGWSEDGQELRGNGLGPSVDGHSPELWYAVNPATGAVRSIPEPPRNADGSRAALPAEALPFHWRKAVAGSDGKVLEKTLQLESADGNESVTIAAEGTPLALTREAAVYTIAGALYVAPIERIGREKYQQLTNDLAMGRLRERAERLSDALVVYAFQHDRVYPAADADLAKLLGKSIATTDLDGFVYQPPAIRQMERIAAKRQLLGTIAGTGGRMAFYNDGHMEWQPTGGK